MKKLFNISEAASLGIHSLALIAQSKDLLNVNKIVSLTNFSKNHLAKVLQTLAKFGFIKSARGPKGGFLLNRDSKEITLLEIYEALEGKVENVHCSLHKEFCPFKKCIFGGLSSKFTNEFTDYMSKTTIYQVAGK